MPYKWSSPSGDTQTLTLWPHQSLPPRGFVWFIGLTVGMLLLPLMAVLGSVVLWFLLPFLMLAVGGVWFAIHRNRRAAQVTEVLTLTETQAHLIRQTPDDTAQEWQCNRFWATPQCYETDGPVPKYVTLRGNGREVEIGAFLSEDERITLYNDLLRMLRQ